jgi:hypothetical protein
VMDRRSAKQVRLIAEVSGMLASHRIDHWLFGGWAVDFLFGAVTRAHNDVEIVVWKPDIGRIRTILEPHGYRWQEVAYPDEGAALLKEAERVGFTFIELNEGGAIVTPERWSDWPWPERSFSDLRGTLSQVTVPVVSPEAQLDTKVKYRKHPKGRPLRDKDRHDIRILMDILRVGEPDPAEIWAEMDRLAEELRDAWPEGLSAADAVAEDRR